MGCYKYAWIFNSLINWVKKFSSITRFFYTALIATMKLVYLSTAKKTLPNFPSPNFYTISKLSIVSSCWCVCWEEYIELFLEIGPYCIFLLCWPFCFKKDGIAFSERAACIMFSVKFVELVYFRCLAPFVSKVWLLT